MAHMTEKIVFIEAEGMQESGGNYTVVNSSSGALGKYQVMPANLAPWLRECGIGVVSAHTYLHTPAMQDELAMCKLGGDYDTYGPRGAAAVWYSGQPNWHAKYGNPPVYQYVADVMAWMERISKGKVNIPAPPERTLPPPKESDWHHHIDVTVKGLHQHRNQLHGYHSQLWHLMRNARAG